MTVKYAEIATDEQGIETVARERSFPEALEAWEIKSVDGKPLLRPIVEAGYDGFANACAALSFVYAIGEAEVTKQYAVDLARVKEVVSAKIDDERDTRRHPGDVDTGLGWPVDLRNATDESNINGKVALALCIKAASTAETITFMGADNQAHVLSADDMIAVGRACDEWISAVYVASWTIKALLADEDATLDDLKAIDPKAGWPVPNT